MRSLKYLFIICALLLVSSIQVVSAEGTYEYVLQWNSTLLPGGDFISPTGIAVDSAGNVYVVDMEAGRVRKFNSSGTYLPWSSPDLGSWSFHEPVGIAVDRTGNIYVTNWSQGSSVETYSPVEKFDASGQHLPWSSPDAFAELSTPYPYGIAVDSAGNIYVCNYQQGGQVQKFNSSGTLLPWGDAGNPANLFNHPFGVAVDSADNVYVTDPGNQQVMKFNSSGSHLLWTPSGLAGEPYGVAVDSAGNVFVSGMENSISARGADSDFGGDQWVQKFDSTGTFVTPLGNGTGTGDGYFNGPFGVAVDSTGNVFVADMFNRRVQKFAQPRSPVVNFTANVTNGLSPLAVGFTDQSTGIVTSWFWTFGDGNTSTEQNPVHTYTTSGIFPVSLTATNAVGSTPLNKADYITVTALTPTAPTPSPGITSAFYALGHVGQAPYSVRFLDQSAGSPTAWKWDFGDGSTSTEQNPTHVFNRTGVYNVALTASNDLASDTSIQYRCIIVNAVPTANFTANQTAGRTPFTVQFTDDSSAASGYQWQFGDGQTSTGQNPVHTYTVPGTYTVTLIISVPDYGSVFVQKPGYITVTDPPTVGFSANVTAGLAPLNVQFNESTTGSVQYFYWQFGDGGSSFDRNPIHVYDAAGKYTVSLFAAGSNGTQVKTIEQYINVTNPVTPTTTTPAPVNTTIVPTTTTVAPTVTTIAPTMTAGIPYNGPHTIPGTLQAEDYDLGGDGVAYHDTTAGNTGGAYRQDDVDIEQLDTDGSPNVGWIRSGEWLTYTVNVATAGTYDAGFRVACNRSNSHFGVYVDDGTTPVANVDVPNTGEWPVFRTVQVPVTLPAGIHRLKFSFPTDFANINWISFALRG